MFFFDSKYPAAAEKQICLFDKYRAKMSFVTIIYQFE